MGLMFKTPKTDFILICEINETENIQTNNFKNTKQTKGLG